MVSSWVSGPDDLNRSPIAMGHFRPKTAAHKLRFGAQKPTFSLDTNAQPEI